MLGGGGGGGGGKRETARWGAIWPYGGNSCYLALPAARPPEALKTPHPLSALPRLPPTLPPPSRPPPYPLPPYQQAREQGSDYLQCPVKTKSGKQHGFVAVRLAFTRNSAMKGEGQGEGGWVGEGVTFMII